MNATPIARPSSARNLQGDGVWRSVSAIVGMVGWLGIAMASDAGLASIPVIAFLFLLAPLVVVPLGLAVLDHQEPPTFHYSLRRGLQLFQPLAAFAAAASFHFEAGAVAAVLAAPWLLFSSLVALEGVLRWRSGLRLLTCSAFIMARFDLLVASSWFMASRLGICPMGFREPIVLLTAMHFHYIGFAAAVLAGTTLNAQQDAPGTRRFPLLRIIVAAVLIVPFVLAAGFVFSPLLKLGAALALCLSMAAFSVFMFLWLPHLRCPSARVLAGFSAGLLLFGMTLAAIYSIGEYTGANWLSIPEMARLHGMANGPGFVLLGLLSWLFELRHSQHETTRRVEKPRGSPLADRLRIMDGW